MILDGGLQGGELTGFLSYVLQVMNSFMMISNVFLLLTRSLASAHRIAEVLEEVPDIQNPFYSSMADKIQNLLLKEYSRLRSSERSLLFFISTVSQMTGAERDLVRLLLDGKKLKEIAAIRCVEVVTVKTQVKSLLRKLGCTRTKEIVDIIRELNVAHLF
mgnify:CR=1 FL=1